MTVKVMSTTQLRGELVSVLERLGEIDHVVVSRRGKEQAVLIEMDRYTRLVERLEYLEDTLDAVVPEREDPVPADQVL